MTDFNGSISDFVAGDDLDVTRTVTDVPSGQTLTKAWLTLKKNLGDDDPGLLQKTILPGAVAGQGQITNTGASGTGAVLFQLSKAETAILPVGRKVAYDIQVLTSADKIYTAERGYYYATKGVTTASS